MKILTTIALVLALAAPLSVMTTLRADAGSTIERACLNSDRSAASQPLCNCIQRVADQILTRRDQKMAARFFTDPHKAQEIRQSDRASHEAFWQRYRAFGTSAGNICG